MPGPLPALPNATASDGAFDTEQVEPVQVGRLLRAVVALERDRDRPGVRVAAGPLDLDDLPHLVAAPVRTPRVERRGDVPGPRPLDPGPDVLGVHPAQPDDLLEVPRALVRPGQRLAGLQVFVRRHVFPLSVVRSSTGTGGGESPHAPERDRAPVRQTLTVVRNPEPRYSRMRFCTPLVCGV